MKKSKKPSEEKKSTNFTAPKKDRKPSGKPTGMTEEIMEKQKDLPPGRF